MLCGVYPQVVKVDYFQYISNLNERKKKQENEINGKQLRSLQQRHTGNILHILTILQLNEAKKKKITTILRNETESDQLGLAIFIFSPVLTVRCLFASQTRI